MCGRFQLQKPKQLNLRLKLKNAVLLKKQVSRMNIAPTQNILTVIKSETPDTFELREMRWGLIPSWSKEEKPKFNMFNTRSEGFTEKPYFKGLLTRKRCLIPATGFYEWKKAGKIKIPHLITVPKENIFCFGGVFDVREDEKGEITHSCSIITMAPNQWMKSIHDRMPVVIPQEYETNWLEDDQFSMQAFEFAQHIKFDHEEADSKIFKKA
jgi:putative SOS response-associated peptidase YedK